MLRLRAYLGAAIAAAFAAVPGPAVAQQASIQGIVTSAVTLGALEGVEIALLGDGRQAHGTLTDRNGFYQIGGIPPGTYTLRARYLGHTQHQHEVRFSPGARVTVSFRLEPEAVAVEGVVVTAAPSAAIRDLGRQRITPAELRLVPVPAGSGDLASFLQTLPGVVTTGDRGGQLFVRGGTPAENLVLVDGIPIYQPFHILGFFSVFPEDLVSSVDFYAGGFGAQYYGRTSSVLDVRLRDGNPNRNRVLGSIGPFVTEALAEGPAGPGVSWMASVRRSLVEETSEVLLGSRQPLSFDSQLLKLSVNDGDHLRCSALGLRTMDRGRIDPEDRESHVAWNNLLVGGRCVALFERLLLRLVEVNFSYTSVDNTAVSRESSRFRSSVGRIHHEVNTSMLLGSLPLYAGYHVYSELTDYNLAEIYGLQERKQVLTGFGGYMEFSATAGEWLEVRPGITVTTSPLRSLEPRLRASLQPFGRPDEKLQGSVGVYRQNLVGTSDMRDIGSVFVAWMPAPQNRAVEATHALLGWQQTVDGGFQYSIDGYYKRLRDIPVPAWNSVAHFTTRLARAAGEVYGADARIELRRPSFYGFVGYGYAWTEYVAADDAFGLWFDEPVQRYHPPHDRRHQVNALASVDVAGVSASARWQFGSGLPFTRPMGFEETFDYTWALHDPSRSLGTTRMILDRPFTARLPVVHRLDLSLERRFELSRGRLTLQAGAINAYNRRNLFYYDLYTGRRVDQLPFAPYAAVTFRAR